LHNKIPSFRDCTLIFIADGENGLVIVDGTDKSSPRYLGGCSTDHYADDVFVQEEYAFLTDRNTGLTIIELVDTKEDITWDEDPAFDIKEESWVNIEVTTSSGSGSEERSFSITAYTITAAFSQSEFIERIEAHFGFSFSDDTIDSSFTLIQIQGMLNYVEDIEDAYNNAFSGIFGTIDLVSGFLPFSDTGSFYFFFFFERTSADGIEIVDLLVKIVSHIPDLVKSDPVNAFDGLLDIFEVVVATTDGGIGFLKPDGENRFQPGFQIGLRQIVTAVSILTTLNSQYKLYLQALSETAKTVTFLPTVVGAFFHAPKTIILIADIFFLWVAPDSYITNVLNWMVDLIDPPETTIYPALRNSTGLSLYLGYDEDQTEFHRYNGSIGFFVSGHDIYSGYFDPSLVEDEIIYELICVGDEGVTIPYHQTLGIRNDSIPAISAGSMDANTKISTSIITSDNNGTWMITWDDKLEIQQIITNVTLKPGKIHFAIQAIINAKIAPESSTAFLFIDGVQSESYSTNNGIIYFNISIENDGGKHLFLIEGNAPSLLGDYYSFTYSCDLLDMPLSVNAEDFNETVLISWEHVENATSYIIFRREDNATDHRQIGETSSSRFIDDSVRIGEEYKYRIVSRTNNGMSNYSAEVTVTVSKIEKGEDDNGGFLNSSNIIFFSIAIIAALCMSKRKGIL